MNCWEFKKCGRQPGGAKVGEFGTCPAATDTSANGVNGGYNAGRICWATSGTFCGGKVQGTFADKQVSCLNCEFMKQVKHDEGAGKFRILKPDQVFQARV